jgi:hypothetical protein
MSKVIEILIKQDKNGNDMKVTKFDTGQTVFVNKKYKPQQFEAVEEGKDFNLIKDGDFWAIDDGQGSAPSVQSKKAKEIEHAQDRKAESIAWFNATNNAIEVCKFSDNIDQDCIRNWRKWFLDEWKDQPPF